MDEPDIRFIESPDGGPISAIGRAFAVMEDDRWTRMEVWTDEDGNHYGPPDSGHPGALPFMVRFGFDEHGSLVVNGLVIGDPAGKVPISSRSYRRIKPAELVESFIGQAESSPVGREWLERVQHGREAARLGYQKADAPKRRRGRRPSLTVEQVAELWWEAHREAAGKELRWITDNHHHGYSTVARWVAEAREADLIPPSQHPNAKD